MGKYINQTSGGNPLPATLKAAELVKDGATIVFNPKFQENLVCVVNNGPFEAAAYCYSQTEFDHFNDPKDYRAKIWLTYPHAKELAG